MGIKRIGTPRRSSIIEAEAMCEDCDWTVEAGNAVGLAAQHHKRTGHDVLSYQQIQVHYSKDYRRPSP